MIEAMVLDRTKYDGVYKGDDPAIKAALERVHPVSIDAADWSEEQGYGVIDGFLAVVDGREDLNGALEKARELIKRAEFEAVTIVRQSQTLQKTEGKVDDLFWNASFGHEGVVRPDRTVGSRPAQQGTILINPDQNNFYIKKPGELFSAMNTIRELLGHDVPQFKYKKAGLINGGPDIGKDVKEIFGQAGKVFPEYMSVYLSSGASTSEPGLMHFDSGYQVQEVDTHGSLNNRSYSQLPKKFVEAADERRFDALPGGVTITASIIGGGSIVRKTDPDRYMTYKQHEVEGTLKDNKVYFQDDEDYGYQAQDGDIMIMRNDKWPDDEHGNARLPSDHCSTILNAYGNTGNHLGRVVGLMSSQVCYMSPQVREHLGMSRMPEPREYEPARNDDVHEVLEQA